MKHAVRIISAVVIGTTGSFALATTANAAPAAKCTAARKGQVVGKKACVIKDGKYQWASVVIATPAATKAAPAPSSDDADTSVPVVGGGALVPSRFKRFTSSDGTFGISMPITWGASTQSNGDYQSFDANGGAIASLRITMYDLNNGDTPSSVLRALVSNLRDANHRIIEASGQSKTADGHTFIWVRTHPDEVDAASYTDIQIFLPNKTVSVQYYTDRGNTERIKSRPENVAALADRRAELATALTTVTVK
jgi:hypothetical protein